MSTFRVEGQLGLDGSRFFGVLGQAQTAVGRFGRNVTSSLGARLAGLFSVGAVTMFARRTLEYADNIEEASQRIGVGVEKWQEWAFAAAQAGSSVEKLEGFMQRLTSAAGNMKNLEGFKSMGINTQGMTPGGLFQAVNQFTRGRGTPEILAAFERVGLSVRQVSGVLGLLQTDLDAAGASARGLGAVMSKETINTLGKLNDQLSIVSKILMTQFGPALLEVAKIVLKSVGGIEAGAGYLGARTANISGSDALKMALATSLGPAGIAVASNQLKKRLAEGAEMGLDKAAENEFKSTINAMDDTIKRLMAYTGAPEGGKPRINVTNRARQGASKREQIASDSLVGIGNFLGAGARSTIAGIAQQQLQEQRRSNDLLTDIKDALDEDTLGLP